MSGYVDAGYVVVLASLGSYSVSVVVRERAARNRLRASAHADDEPPAEEEIR